MMTFLHYIIMPRLLKVAQKEGGEIVYRSNWPIDWIHFRNGRDLTKAEIRSFKNLIKKGGIVKADRCDEIDMIDVNGNKSILQFPIYTIVNKFI